MAGRVAAVKVPWKAIPALEPLLKHQPPPASLQLLCWQPILIKLEYKMEIHVVHCESAF